MNREASTGVVMLILLGNRPLFSALQFVGAKDSVSGVVPVAQAGPVAPVVSVAGSGKNSKKNT